MEKDFKKIAVQLGIMVPTCLLSMNTIATEKTTQSDKDMIDVPSVKFEQNDVVKMLAMKTEAGTLDKMSFFQHTDRHTNVGGNHSNRHSDIDHSDHHSNVDAYNKGNQCIPHTNRHSNSAPHTNSHENTGQYGHSDNHTNVTPKTNC